MIKGLVSSLPFHSISIMGFMLLEEKPPPGSFDSNRVKCNEDLKGGQLIMKGKKL